MRRDMELIRKILLAIEDHKHGFTHDKTFEFPGHSDEQIGYHNYLICDEGLADGTDATRGGDDSPSWMIHHLTAAGHDFVDAIKSESVWAETMETVKKAGGTATLDIVNGVAIAIMTKMMGIT